ncbi:UNVERIFIED_CONTAM: DUF2232 domain-containing protein, partial [Klebsiella pneumoniae]
MYTFLGWIIAGPIAAAIALSGAVWGSAMGIVYAKRGKALPAIVAGAGVVFLSTVFGLAFMAFGMNLNFQTMLEQTAQMRPSFVTKEQFDQTVALIKMVLPTSIVMFSFISSAITHGLASLIGKRIKKPIPALKPIREWSFPRSLLYYYFLAMVSILVFGDSMQGTFWE